MGGCALGVISVFLPISTVSSGYGFKNSVSFIEGDGKIVLVFLIASAILLFFKKDLISLIPVKIMKQVVIKYAIVLLL